MNSGRRSPYHSPGWWASLGLGGSYCLAAWNSWTGDWVVVWKGSGVTCLAIWLFSLARASRQAPERILLQRLALVLALGALGDVLLAIHGLVVGALAFAAGHLLALHAYGSPAIRRGSRRDPWAPLLGAGVSAGVTYALLQGQALAPLAVVYALLVGAMAGAAWQSRLARHLTGLGACLFLVSDWLIFAGQAIPATVDLARIGVWPLYFGGQALIAAGIASGLALPSSTAADGSVVG